MGRLLALLPRAPQRGWSGGEASPVDATTLLTTPGHELRDLGFPVGARPWCLWRRQILTPAEPTQPGVVPGAIHRELPSNLYLCRTECGSHQACRVHDACYDRCGVAGEMDLVTHWGKPLSLSLRSRLPRYSWCVDGRWARGPQRTGYALLIHNRQWDDPGVYT
jgi:hypothetical protein